MILAYVYTFTVFDGKRWLVNPDDFIGGYGNSRSKRGCKVYVA